MEYIKSFGRSQLHVDSHAEFNLSVYMTVASAVFTNTDMAALLPVYKEAIDLERQIIARPRASTYTQTVAEEDNTRGGMLKQLVNTIVAARMGNMPNIKEAADNLWIVVKPYRNAYATFMADETDKIANLLSELGKDMYADWIDVLSLAGVVQKLRQENNKFRETYNKRATERGLLPGKGITTREQRKVVDGLYNKVVHLLNSAVDFTRSSIDTGFDAEKLATTTLSINSFIDQYKLILANTAKKKKEEQAAQEAALLKENQLDVESQLPAEGV